MYYGLQVARGIAALLVLFHHISLGSDVFYGTQSFSGFFEFGSIGVDFFFVLSGFIIYWVHSDDNQSLKNGMTYFKKRMIRIYPPFILVSVVLLIAYNLFPTLSNGDRNIGVITSLFLIPTPPLDPALSVSWTLMHEMLFYIIFLCLYIRKKLFFGFLMFWSLSILLISFTSIQGIIKTFFLNPHNLEFILGVMSAIIIKRQKGEVLHLVIGLLMFCLYVYFYRIGLIESYNLLPQKIYLGVCFMLIVTGLCKVDHKIKYPNFLLLLGSASYSIYLIHNPIISILNRIAQKLLTIVKINQDVVFIIVAMFSLIFGLVYYFIWEKPLLKFFKKKFI